MTARLVLLVRRPLQKNSSRVVLMSRLEEYLDTLRGCVRIVVDVGVKLFNAAIPLPVCAVFSVFVLVLLRVPCNVI